MRRILVALSLASVAGCGSVESAIDAASTHDAAHPDASTTPDGAPAPDATKVPCTTVASTATSPLLTFTLAGGSFQSYGCAPIDPTYWLAGAAGPVTIAFTNAQDRPQIRVWGMNTDDVASVAVNGNAYTLDSTSASLTPKVTCGLSPGPDGVAFVGGNLVGANSPSAGNYSYQDVTLETTGVTRIDINSLAGAGWGFVGVSVGCAN